jgi:hypothetical protein
MPKTIFVSLLSSLFRSFKGDEKEIFIFLFLIPKAKSSLSVLNIAQDIELSCRGGARRGY